MLFAGPIRGQNVFDDLTARFTANHICEGDVRVPDGTVQDILRGICRQQGALIINEGEGTMSILSTS